VLDEADEMLHMGFKEELDAILEGTPSEKQTLLFSATMPREILRIADQYMHQPYEITIGVKNAGAENVSHEFYVSHARNRYEVLKRIADMNPSIYGIVFCRTRQETKDVAEKLMADGYNADALHGDLSQAQRDHVMNRFRKKHLQMLVATDVAARGLDVNDLTHVINYNLPSELEAYIHRSGRTGRAGKTGISITIVHTREIRKIKDLEKITRKQFKKKQIPGGKEICKKQLFNLIDKVENIETNDEQIAEFLPEINKKLSWLSREDLIKHFVSVEFNRFLSYYKDAPDLNVESGAAVKEKGKRDRKRSSGEFSRFFINLGSKNGMTPPKLIGLVNDATNTRHIEIGKIEIMKKFSFFEIDRQYEGNILGSFRQNMDFYGTRVAVQLSRPDHASTKGKDVIKKRKQKKKGGGKRKKNTRSF
jgi:ATP-dependent RNA helicase DeaD